MTRRESPPRAGTSPNRVLSLNLASLIGPGVPVADAARHIGISRLKLSRFIQGTSFPRPEELSAICTAFGVDARIVLEPLEELRQRQMREGQMRALSEVFNGLPMPVESPSLPTGLYQIWRRSLVDVGMYHRGLMQVETFNGFKACRGYESRTLYPDGTVTDTLKLRLYRGLFVDFDRGARIGCLFVHNRPSSVATLAYLEHVPGQDFYAGFGALTRAYSSDMIRFYGFVLQKVETSPRMIVELAHRKLIFDAAEVPPEILERLDLEGFF